MPWHPIVTVADLARLGLARQAPESTAWQIDAEGYRMIRKAATA